MYIYIYVYIRQVNFKKMYSSFQAPFQAPDRFWHVAILSDFLLYEPGSAGALPKMARVSSIRGTAML